MPIYAYKCESCAHVKDVLQKISDPLLTVCPACGEPAFKKQLTAAGFQLKGSGWYVTDFKGGADSGAAKGGKESEPAPSAEKAGSAAGTDASGSSSSAGSPGKASPAASPVTPSTASPAASGGKPSTPPASGV